MDMATKLEEVQSDIGGDAREFMDDHRLLTYFLLIETFFVFSAYYLDTWVSVTLTADGPDLSDILAGLLGGWAVAFGGIGLIGFALIFGSRILLRYGRST